MTKRDTITVEFSLGEYFCLRSALEQELSRLDRYDRMPGLTESQRKDVEKFKREANGALRAVAAARARWLNEPLAKSLALYGVAERTDGEQGDKA